MLKFIYIYIIFLIPFSLKAQEELNKKHFFASFNYKFGCYWRRDPITFDEIYSRRFQSRPEVGYFITKKQAVGVFAEFDRNWSNFVEEKKHYGVGLSYRRYRTNPFDWTIPRKRLRTYVDATYFYSNFLTKRKEEIRSIGLKYHEFTLGFGWSFRVYKGLNLGAVYRFEIPIGGFPQIVRRISITYHI